MGWGEGGGWNDGTPNASPDWIEVDFTGMKTIDEINVFSMQDSYSAPVEPTQTMTFSYWGLRAFEVQYLERVRVGAPCRRRRHQQQQGLAPVRVRAR